MGQTASNLARTASKPVSWLMGKSGNDGDVKSHCGGLVPYGGNLFVHRRRGSMYFDEDGDLAHEFYKEVTKGNRVRMEKCHKNLKPQGEVKHPIPRLHGDLPVFIYEVPSTVLAGKDSR